MMLVMVVIGGGGGGDRTVCGDDTEIHPQT